MRTRWFPDEIRSAGRRNWASKPMKLNIIYIQLLSSSQSQTQACENVGDQTGQSGFREEMKLSQCPTQRTDKKYHISITSNKRNDQPNPSAQQSTNQATGTGQSRPRPIRLLGRVTPARLQRASQPVTQFPRQPAGQCGVWALAD